MKFFGRTGGYYLFWTGFVYFCVGMYLAFTHSGLTEFATLGFILALSVPLGCPPVARYFNMEPVMFDFFKFKKNVSNMDNVYNLPKAVAPMPEVEPPKKEEPAKIYYRLGLADNNRVAFSMGYSEITMSHKGVQQMIDQLAFFQSQLDEEIDDPSDDPDGGESLPVPEQKAA
jgi:hypothetical protein